MRPGNIVKVKALSMRDRQTGIVITMWKGVHGPMASVAFTSYIGGYNVAAYYERELIPQTPFDVDAIDDSNIEDPAHHV